MGKVLENYFIPGVVVIAILIGGWAAKNYDNDADIFIKPCVALALLLLLLLLRGCNNPRQLSACTALGALIAQANSVHCCPAR